MPSVLNRLDRRARRLAKSLWNKRPQPSIQEKFPQYEIGRGTYGIPKIRNWQTGPTLRIGAFCSIADGVQIFLGGEHRVDWVTTYPFSVKWAEAKGIDGHPRSRGDVVIGNDVWIGWGATIMSGVTIGDGAVIGAESLITRDVEPYSIVAGNPGVLVRKRFTEDQISRLLQVRWWDWDDARIAACLPQMLNDDIEAFLSAAEASSR